MGMNEHNTSTTDRFFSADSWGDPAMIVVVSAMSAISDAQTF
jgi:hypothetical protein